MKLLLTSCGIANASIARALFALVNKKPEDTTLVFVPTAANVDPGDKGWLIDDLVNLKKLNLKWIDIVDISAIDRRQWLARMEQADVLYFGGGKRYHLMDWMTRSGLTEALPQLLDRKLYVGMSAGSMVTGSYLDLRFSHILYRDDLDRTEELQGLGYVDFYVLPHLNNSYFPNVQADLIEKVTKDTSETVYALDDASALVVVDREVSVVTEGTYRIYKAQNGSRKAASSPRDVGGSDRTRNRTGRTRSTS